MYKLGLKKKKEKKSVSLCLSNYDRIKQEFKWKKRNK